MENLESQKKNLTLKDFKPAESSTNKPVPNFFDTYAKIDPLNLVWGNPVGKVVIISGVSVMLIYASGHLLGLFAWWLDKFHQFKNAGKGPTSLPPKG